MRQRPTHLRTNKQQANTTGSHNNNNNNNNRGSVASSASASSHGTTRSSTAFHWNLRSLRFDDLELSDLEDDNDHENTTNNDEGEDEFDSSNLLQPRKSLRHISEASNESSTKSMFEEVDAKKLPRKARQRYSQTAADIFCKLDSSTVTTTANMDLGQLPETSSSSPKVPPPHDVVKTRIGVVNGHEVKFELREGVSERPSTDREERLRRCYKNIHNPKSKFESKMRFWLMRREMGVMSAIYLAAFVAMNVIFAALFYIEADRCCDNPELTFSEVFAFTVQTSTTIGYGGYIPQGYYANFLVVVLSFVSTLLSTVFAGLIFARFARPEAKLVFSNVMTYSNFNGLPCLQVRVGNVDGWNNKLLDVEARLTYLYLLTYEDENGHKQEFGQTEELRLLNDKQQVMRGVWTLRHVLDETSPLFGLDFFKYPGSSIMEFRISITATQETTQGVISEQTGYMKEDVMIGHGFDDQAIFNVETQTVINDYNKMSATHPQPVWYPSSDGWIPP